MSTPNYQKALETVRRNNGNQSAARYIQEHRKQSGVLSAAARHSELERLPHSDDTQVLPNLRADDTPPNDLQPQSQKVAQALRKPPDRREDENIRAGKGKSNQQRLADRQPQGKATAKVKALATANNAKAARYLQRMKRLKKNYSTLDEPKEDCISDEEFKKILSEVRDAPTPERQRNML